MFPLPSKLLTDDLNPSLSSVPLGPRTVEKTDCFYLRRFNFYSRINSDQELPIFLCITLGISDYLDVCVVDITDILTQKALNQRRKTSPTY